MIIKQSVGAQIHLGGQHDEIEPLNFSIYNFNNNFNSDLQSLGGDFYYFCIDEYGYLKARSKNIWYNQKTGDIGGDWKSRYRRARASLNIAIKKAKKELDSYENQIFIKINDNSNYKFSFGEIPRDLEKINTNHSEEQIKEKIVYSENQSAETDESEDFEIFLENI